MRSTKRLTFTGNLAYILSAAFVIAAVIVSLLPPAPVLASNAGSVAGSSAGIANPGAIWTTLANCGTDAQDVNHFDIGEHVFINGSGFLANTSYSWDITGQPGHASADPGSIVASGIFVTDGTGAFCFDAYTVANDDDGEYQVKFSNKGDNYRVDGVTLIPGCMDEAALNYNSDATTADDSCRYEEGEELPVPYAELNCYALEFSSYKVIVGNTGATGEIGYSTDLDATIVSLGEIANGGSVELLVSGSASTLNLYAQDGDDWEETGSISLSQVELWVCEEDPISLISYCSYVNGQQPVGWTVNNLNAFPISITWDYGAESSAAPIAMVAGSSYSFATSDQSPASMYVYVDGIQLASGGFDLDCPQFAPLSLTAFCSGDPANFYGWTASNSNPFGIDAEWRVNGSALTGLITIPANATLNFITPAAEGNIVQLYVGGVQQDDAGAVADCVVPDFPPEVPQIPQTPGTPATSTTVLIPVTGFSDDLAGILPVGLASLALSFLGLGIVLQSIARRVG